MTFLNEISLIIILAVIVLLALKLYAYLERTGFFGDDEE